MPVQIQLRNGTAAQWTAANPTLAAGEVGIESDTKKQKFGDGTTAWNSLGYVGGTGTVTSVTGTSPVASSGGTTPAISLNTAYGDTLNPYASKTANQVLAAPNGSAGVPSFRAIVSADIPTLNQNTTGTAAGLSSTLAVSSGGTGQTTYTDGQLLIGNSTGNTLTKATLTAGTNVTITNSAGGITIAASGGGGGVTSVTGTSPVASSGGTTPAISLSTAYGDTLNPYASKTANYVLAAPNGSAGVPTFRAIVAGDIPTLNQNTTGSAASLSSTLAVASGGTGLTATPTNGQIDIGNGTGFTRTTLTAGTNVTITNSAGGITIAATGGGSSQWTTSGSNIYYTTGSVGVGTTSPAVSFEVDAASGEAFRVAATGANQSIYSRYIAGSPNVGNLYVGVDSAAGAVSGVSAAGLMWQNGNASLAFGTNNALAMTLTANGTVILKGGSSSATGVGVTFPATQSSSSDVNTLDDYEEGTWTPSIGGTATYNSRWGSYTKVGRIVTCQFWVSVNAIGTGSATTITGLPFTINNPTYANDTSGGPVTYFASSVTSVYTLNIRGTAGAASVFFSGTTAASTTINNSVSVFQNSAAIQASIIYETAT